MSHAPDPTTQKTSALLRRAASDFESLATSAALFTQEDRADFMAMAVELRIRAHRIEAEWEALNEQTIAARRETLRYIDGPAGSRT